MTEAQKRGYAELSGRWCLPFEQKPLNYTDIFDNTNPVVIEIGFGMGTATAIIAAENPEINYIGIEVHTPGVGKLLHEIRERDLRNVRIIEHDAVEALEYMIPDNSVAAFHVFFPDPWPKKRHHKRRFMQRPRTDLLASKLCSRDETPQGHPLGYLYMATDWEPYGISAMEELTATPTLVNSAADVPGGFAPRQEWRPETKFEMKGLRAERDIWELYFFKEQ
ncbi:MAG: tRNA (guanosine(46)-N7)-methyltransferase TrmB [Spirochaetaceae bacterium]|jgi:tRNA (guanine-N7-)-methyltransferase|nr:tRNA (guanosine(46)-N7)-methyltransferase TrmB [Spirochaetaceae bacterium]